MGILNEIYPTIGANDDDFAKQKDGITSDNILDYISYQVKPTDKSLYDILRKNNIFGFKEKSQSEKNYINYVVQLENDLNFDVIKSNDVIILPNENYKNNSFGKISIPSIPNNGFEIWEEVKVHKIDGKLIIPTFNEWLNLLGESHDNNVFYQCIYPFLITANGSLSSSLKVTSTHKNRPPNIFEKGMLVKAVNHNTGLNLSFLEKLNRFFDNQVTGAELAEFIRNYNHLFLMEAASSTAGMVDKKAVSKAIGNTGKLVTRAMVFGAAKTLDIALSKYILLLEAKKRRGKLNSLQRDEFTQDKIFAVQMVTATSSYIHAIINAEISKNEAEKSQVKSYVKTLTGAIKISKLPFLKKFLEKMLLEMINKLYDERADSEKTLQNVKEQFGVSVREATTKEFGSMITFQDWETLKDAFDRGINE